MKNKFTARLYDELCLALSHDTFSPEKEQEIKICMQP